MLPVEIHPIQDAIVLRARGSELLILSSHVAELKKLKAAGDFSRYFLDEALVNRPARKLFEAWLRKDGSLWARIYKTVQTIESTSSNQQATTEKPTKAAKAPETVKEAPAKAPKKTVDAEKTVAKPAAKTATKAADTKPAKKEKSASSRAESAKAAPKAATKSAATKSAAKKPAAKTAAKPAAKKASKK